LRIRSWKRAPPAPGAKNETIIETVAEVPAVADETAIEPVVAAVAVKAPPKKRAKVIKEYPPHEHFGSPLNVCRICGEKYSYVQKPHSFGIGNK
jgi:ribosomal protein S14